jgi:hypothetical protein
MNDSTWLTSVILSLRHKDTEFVSWSKWCDRWTIQPQSLQLFCHLAAKTRSSWSDRIDVPDEWFNMTHFSYFVTSIQRHGVRTVIEVTSQMNHSRWLSSVIFHVDHRTRSLCRDGTHLTNEWVNVTLFSYFVTSLQSNGVRAVIEVNWQMIKSIWLSSVILSLPYKYTEFAPWSKLTDKWLIVFDSVQLVCHIAVETRSSCSDSSQQTND